ncbi:hypothetical protein GTB64_004502 [Salmonella enterica]|nr:hypothetical protein [Salmonella enterica]
MKKLLVIAVLALSASACAQPNAHRNLHGKTQVQDAHGENAQALYTYADSLLEVQVDDNCNVKKVNGFAPKHVKHVKKDMTQVTTQMGPVLSVLKLAPSQCDITWMDKSGKTGILKVN